MRSSTSLAVLAFASAAMAVSAPGICYNSAGPAKYASFNQYQTYDTCRPVCSNLGKPIMALHNGGDCYCADSLPPASAMVNNAQCNTVCNGFGSDPCGGGKAWTFVGVSSDITKFAGSGSGSGSSSGSGSGSSSGSGSGSSSGSGSGSSSSSSDNDSSSDAPIVYASTQVVTSGTAAVTQVITKTIVNSQATDTPTQGNSGGGGGGISTGAIAAAVVVSVVGSAALIAAIIFFLKWKRERDDMSAHRRIQSNSAFGDPPSISDSRLDHTMVERRMSNGSVFADNEDYSRKILRVANPDDR